MNANAHSSSQAQAEQKILDKVIRELIAEGRDKGFVTLDEINAQISSTTTPEQLERILNVLSDMDIEVLDSSKNVSLGKRESSNDMDFEPAEELDLEPGVDNNTDEVVSTMGLDIGLDAKIFGKFDFGAKFAYNEMDRSNIDPNYETSFNTPKVRGRLSLGSTEIGDNIGFNVSASYHNAFLYESNFADGIIPANWIFNASMSFDVPELQSVIKVGAVNLTGDDYMSIPVTGMIGSQYYIKFTLNP